MEEENQGTPAPEPQAEPTRREVVRNCAGAALGGLFLWALGGKLEAGLPETEAQVQDGATKLSGGYDPFRHEWVFLVDIGKCIGCGACVRACERENHVPPHYFRTWVERYRVGDPDEPTVDSPNGGRDGFAPDKSDEIAHKAFFVPKLCNHCRFSPCTQLCPVGASFRSPDGVMLVDSKRCIGCGYCVQACPYGSRFIHPATHTASKCTFCYHRTTKGLRPACVEVCPTGARRFGDMKDPEDEVCTIVATQPTHVLKPELLTKPHCRYIGMSMEVR